MIRNEDYITRATTHYGTLIRVYLNTKILRDKTANARATTPAFYKRTFEVVLYGDNSTLCDALFDSPAVDYMLKNKTEAAYVLLSQADQIVVPDYVKRGITWIRE